MPNDTAAPQEPDYIGTINQPNDPTHPEPPATSQEQDAPNPHTDDEGGEAAPTTFHGDSDREALYARIRERNRGRSAPVADLDALPDATAPFAAREGDDPHKDESIDELLRQANGDEPGAPQPAPAAQPQGQQPAPKTYELKVNRNTYTYTREQLLEAAGVAPDEAQGIPDGALVRAAQLNEAARLRLLEAKNSDGADRRDPAPYPGQGNGQNAEDHDGQSQQHPPVLSDDELVEKIQFGTPEEAKAALREQTRRIMHEEREAEAARGIGQTVDDALSDFQARNPDLIQDERAMALVTTDAIIELKAAMIKAGAPAADVNALTQENATKCYSMLLAKGVALPPVREILNAAEEKTRQTLGLAKPGRDPKPTPTPTPQPTLRVDPRTEAKRALAQTPQRAGTPVVTNNQPATRDTSRREALNKMRAFRGQSPIPA
jgi:hypothetical protein